MIDNRVELMLDILGKIFEDIDMDWFAFREDMAFNHGSLMSPELFKKYMIPDYRRVTDFLRSNGVDITFVDSDGNIDKLIPLWLESGVNGMYPFEVQSGMNMFVTF
jgi:uroporphyrinogen decarboxylase